MESHNKLLFFYLFSIFFYLSLFSSADKSTRRFNPTKLFVFGDSYSDTGNTRKSQDSSWKFPYGITFPGKPSGRFSDGRVLTDFIAKFIGVKTPVAYQWRKVVDSKQLKHGMNFAYGSTGVFKTWVDYPNMTVQIDYFERLINQSLLYTPKDLQSSVAPVTVAGNDYAYFLLKNGTNEELLQYIILVVNQIRVNLKRIHDLGVKKIIMTGLEPGGCLPRSTLDTSGAECNSTYNALGAFHNTLLQDVVDKLNKENSDSPFFVLNLYDSFLSALKNEGDIKFENPLKLCCAPKSIGYACGSVENGESKFTVCEKPQSSFFWDESHPTLFSILQHTIHQLFY